MRSWFGRLLVVLSCIAIIGNVTVCAADDNVQPVPGDPSGLLPGSCTQGPTSAILEEVLVLLVTGGYLALF